MLSITCCLLYIYWTVLIYPQSSYAITAGTLNAGASVRPIVHACTGTTPTLHVFQEMTFMAHAIALANALPKRPAEHNLILMAMLWVVLDCKTSVCVQMPYEHINVYCET